MNCIVITGSSCLVGRDLRRPVGARGHEVRGLALRAAALERGDVLDRDGVAAAVEAIAGVVHLAADSLVAWAERDRSPRVSLEDCLARLVGEFRDQPSIAGNQAGAP
jgi:nucleoside-diphosphate-sugar epimerase